MYAPLPEVKYVLDYHLYLPGLEGAQFLSQYHMCEDEGSLGVPLSISHPLPLRIRDCCKPDRRLTFPLA